MSDFGLFESDEAKQAEPRLAAKTAGRKLEAAIDAVRKDFGRFLLGATGIDEFSDRWHYSKHDIRKTVEPYAFPNTGTMRRVMNAMKADWKLAHPYKLAEGGGSNDSYSGGSTNPSGGIGSYGGPSGAPADTSIVGPGIGSGAMSGGYESFNGDSAAPAYSGGDPSGEYLGVPGQPGFKGASRRRALSHEEAGFGSMPTEDSHRNQDLDETYHPSSGNLIPEGDFEGWKDSVDQNGPEKVQNAFTPGGDSGSDHREAARLVADIYTDFAQANGLRVASLDTLDAYASTGIAESDYRLLESMIVRTAEDCDDEDEDTDESESEDDDDSDSGGEAPDFGGSDEADTDGDGDHDDDDHHDDEGGEEEYNFGDENSDGEHDDADHHDGEDEEEYDFGGGDEGGAGGQQFTVPEQAPELDPQMMQEIPQGDTDGSAPVPPEVIDSLLGLPEGTIEQLLLEEVEQGAPQAGGDDFLGGAGGDNTQPPRMARRRRRQAAPDESEQALMGRQRQQQRDSIDTKFGPRQSKPNIQELYKRAKGGDAEAYAQLRGLWNQRGWTASKAARTFWAAEGDEQQQPEGGGEQAPPQDPSGGMGMDPAAMGGMDPSMMGGGMMPPPGSQAVAPPQPAQPLEDQPAEDALLDTANQAIMQMIDRETQEYQQIIDPLSQALQAIQFAQQVEQAEHPMDVTPPEGTVNVDPSQAPGGQPPMQQQAMRRSAADTRDYFGFGDPDEDEVRREEQFKELNPHLERRVLGPGRDAVFDPNNPDRRRQDKELNENNRRIEHQRALDKREAKKVGALKNAARLIAGRYGLSHGGERMLIQAMSRRNYEHVREALQLLPPDHLQAPQYRAAVRHIGEMFAAENPRFNRDVWMKSVLGQPSTRAAAVEEDDDSDEDDEFAGSRSYQIWKDDPHSFGRSVEDIDRSRKSSRSRHPFDRPRLAGETLVHTPTMDAFEWENDQPRVDDNIAVNDLPKMVGASRADDAVSRFQRWTQWREQNGLVVPGGEGGVHAWMQKRINPAKPKVGPRASGEVHRSVGAEPDQPKLAPKPKVQKAVNPTLKKPKGPKAAPKAASAAEFFLDDFGGDDDDDLTRYHTDEIIDRYRNAEPDTGHHDWLFNELHNRAVKGDRGAAREVMDDIDIDDPDWTYETGRSVGDPVHPKRRKVPTEKYELPADADPRTNKSLLSSRHDATWGEWDPPKTASFFTRRVPGWRWDDHLSGYISKEAKDFACSCGQKIATPSYRTCDCGKVWNVYAIGDSHHLASDTADMYVAREIEVRPGVIMANRKMAGDRFGEDVSPVYVVRTQNGERQYVADDAAHAWEQHADAFGGQDGEEPLDVPHLHGMSDPDLGVELDQREANRKMEGAARLFARLAGEGMSYEDTMSHIDDVLAGGEGHDLHHVPGHHEPNHPDESWGDFEDCPQCGGDGADSYGTDLCSTCNGTGAVASNAESECENCGTTAPSDDLEYISSSDKVCSDCADEIEGEVCPDCGTRPRMNFDGLNDYVGGHHRDCSQARLAGLRLADWTKYDDDVDPVVEAYGKSKIPSTKAPRIPRDWSRREPDGKWKNTNFAPKKK